MSGKIAVLVTLDTKAQEADYVRQQIAALGGETVLVDLGVVGEPGVAPDVTREEIATAGGKSLAELLAHPTRQEAQDVYGKGVSIILADRVASGELGAVLGMGGTQGSSICARIMQTLPYGFPKVLVSTCASGDVSPFVDIKDINMYFSVSDLLGLNPITRMVLANAAGAAWGMAQVARHVEARHEGKAVIGMTNLGVLTNGAIRAQQRIEAAGHEVIVFHAVGSGGRAMEQMMKEGLITAVFDYALGEIADDLYSGLRAGGPDRLTVAGDLGLPQVITPGGSEHLGIFVKEPNHVPDEYADYMYTFHSRWCSCRGSRSANSKRWPRTSPAD